MENKLVTLDEAKQNFEIVFASASNISIIQNAGAAFEAVQIVTSLRGILTDEIMKTVFMPLMNQKVGFLTDRSGKPYKGETKAIYDIETVRNCIVDAVCFGLLPTFNQFNIIADRMYPTKEGYTALLKKIGVKYVLTIGNDKETNQKFAEMDCSATYEHNGEKKNLPVKVSVRKDSYSSPDQLKGKAERRVKKALFEFITGCDFGDADEDSSKPTIDITKSQKPKPREFYANDAEIDDDLLKGAITKDQAIDFKFQLEINGNGTTK